MHSEEFWLINKLKTLHRKTEKKSFLTLDAINFCKELNEKDYATALFAAMFDITTKDILPGFMVRKIDRIVMEGETSKEPSIEKYDSRLAECMDESKSPLGELFRSFKSKYKMNQIPEVDDCEFEKMKKIVRKSKRRKLFNPMNLRY